MNKYEQYEHLAEATLNHLLDTPDDWVSFLDTASSMYKYSFDEQLMIYAQRPKTVACASFDFWTAADKMNLSVQRGTKGIALLNKDNKKIYYVYAVEDTVPRKNGLSKNPNDYRWSLTPDKVDGVKSMILSRYHYSSDNLSKSLVAMAVKETDKYIAKYDVQFKAKANELGISFTPELAFAFSEVLHASVAYSLCKRCGIDARSLLKPDTFSKINQFDSRFSVLLGQSLSVISKNTIRQVEQTVGLAVKQKGSIENERRINEQNRGEITSNSSRKWNNLHTRSDNGDISSVLRTEPGGTGRNQTLGTNERKISEGREGRSVSGTAPEQQTESTSSGNRQQSIRDAAAARSVDGSNGWSGRGSEDNRSDEMGRVDEQLQSSSRRDNNEGIDIRLVDDNDDPDVDSKSQMFYDDELLKSEIEAELLLGSSNIGGKFKIYEFYLNSPSDEEFEIFLKNEYGSGSHSTSPILHSKYDNTGYEFSFNTPYGKQNLHLSWSDISLKIKYLLDSESYISKSDIESHIKQAYYILNNADPLTHKEKIEYAHSVIDKYDSHSEAIEDIELHSQLSIFEDNFNNEKNAEKDLTKTDNRSDDIEKVMFQYHDGDEINGGAKIKFRMNVEAIKTLKTVEAEERMANADEQLIMSRYVGWGGIPQAFDIKNDKWNTEYTQLAEILNDAEYAAARKSTQSAFYTSPVVIDSMYQTLINNEFKSGKILEPAMGVGNFFSLMPENVRKQSELYGVEIDSISGRISKQLHQDANIDITGFEKTEFNDDSFDLVIGNVPFGASKLNEKRYNQYNFNIHDHFFAKALDKVKPGGIVAFVTSKGTLDKKNPDVRKYIAKRAELIGAIRLPSGSFNTTDVTSDIIFLQKREKAIEIEPDWVHVGQNENGFTINNYFLQHPDMVLGNIVQCNKLYGSEDDTMCIPFENVDLKELLNSAILKIKFSVSEEKYIDDVIKDTVINIPADIKKFSYTVIDDKLCYYTDNTLLPVKKNKNEKCIRNLVDIRDTLKSLINAQLNDEPDEVIEKLQHLLNAKYDSFKDKFGHICDINNQKAFSEDMSLPLLLSLEYSNKEGKIEKAPIFTKRTINPKIEVNHADTSLEALAISISKKADVNLKFMSELTGFEPEKIKTDLKGIIFENPAKKDEFGNYKLETADEYLSGNIREKLNYVKSLDNERFSVNINALNAAMPKKLEACDIDVRLGCTWIDPEYIKQFVFDVLKTNSYLKRAINIEFSPYSAEWKVEGKSSDSYASIANTNYGTNRKNAYQILEDSLNLRPIKVTDTIELPDGKKKSILNQKETTLAQDKQNLMQNAFKEWIFKDPERREALVDKYNVIYNSTRPREYDGSHLEFPGMNSEIKLRDHQKSAIAHALYGGNTLFAHEVGAGKTFEMIATAMEGKRLGLHNKSLIAVPGHLTEQMGADFLKLYPNANILVATSADFTKKNRQKLFSKIATGDFDAIIVGHSQLLKVPVSQEFQSKIIQKQIDEMSEALADIRNTDKNSFTVKQMEKMKDDLEVKLSKLLESPKRDDVIDFEQLGVDKLFVDEAHLFKNLMITTKMSNISGLSTNANIQKTMDLYAKCQYLDEITGGKGIVFATGTPVSNSISEIYTMMRYLQSNLLERNGMNYFDAWAANFAETITESQLMPEGGGYQMKTRFAKFTNMPELMAMFKDAADIKTADMLNLKVPECIETTVISKPTEMQKSMIEHLAERAAAIRNGSIDRKVDNMPMVTNDGRKIGLDARLMNPDIPDEPGTKINICVDNVYEIWKDTSDDKSTQLIFSDLGVPHDDGGFNIYSDIKSKLISKGVPENEIKFIHDAKNEAEKDKLFSDVRAGNVRVLIGSTQKMGAGTNVQDKMIAMHNIDAPWKPSDFAQRRGRIVRQGNTNEKVKVFKYITESTFDSYLYQTLENKQKYISQIMTSKSPVRSCQDIDEVTLSYAEVKALATGDPTIKERMDLEVDISKLKMLKANHQNSQYKLEEKILKHYPRTIAELESKIAAMKEDVKYVSGLQPDKLDADGNKIFGGVTVQGKFISDKKEAGERLKAAITASAVGCNHQSEIGEYKGFKLTSGFDILNNKFIGYMTLNAQHRIEFGESSGGNFTRMENVIANIEKEKDNLTEKLSSIRYELEESKKEIGKEFPHEKELVEKTARLEELTKILDAGVQSENKHIDEPYFVEVTAEQIEIFEEKGIYYEKSNDDSDENIVIKIDKADKERADEVINGSFQMMRK